jgi:para-nitrobenzyl esterase
MTQPIVTTEQGQVQGETHDGVSCFLGIPYAAAPVGELRFAAPASAPSWPGVRVADAYGPTAPKAGYSPPFSDLLVDPSIAGDEWLNLNVWTPADAIAAPGAGLPVMVWIHGGAFLNGSSAVPVYDGHNFARDGVVCVTLNYRLGVDGFAHLPDGPDNRGLLDQIAALEWVRDNIAAFGGDPSNVTIFGQSAGGMSVTTLLAMPAARGLFHRAIAQSGAVQAAASIDDATGITARLADRLGVAPTGADFARIDLATLSLEANALRRELNAALDKSGYGKTIVAAAMPFIPVVDGETLPIHPLAAIAGGAGRDVVLLTGATTDEQNFFLVPTGVSAALTEDIAVVAASASGADSSVWKVYRGNRPDARPGDVFSALLTDAYFRLPALAVADARLATGATTYVYEFAERTAVSGMGACHALDVGFVFDNLDSDGTERLAMPSPSQQVADEMHSAWVRFATDGDPGWPEYDADRPTMIFADGQTAVASDPRGDERAAWAAGDSA